MKVNKNLIALISVIVIAVLITVLAIIFNSIEKGREFNAGDYTVISKGSGICITKYNGDKTSVVIPEKLDRKKVVSVDAGAFLNTNVEEISFASKAANVELEDACFANNTKLKKVVLPGNLKIIPRDCFSGCSELLDVVIPESVEYIGQYAFNNCTKFTRDYEAEGTYRYFVLPKNLKEVCEYAFNGCAQLDAIKVSDKLTTIGNSAFRESGLQKIVVQEENQELNIQSIGEYAFYKSFLKSTNSDELILNKLETIGKFAFSSITQNFEKFAIAASVTSIGESAFAGTSVLREVEIKQNNANDKITLGVNTFANCVRLSKVTIPDKVVAIPDGMFMGCLRLLNTENLVLGEKVRTIGNGAFAIFASSSSDRNKKDVGALNGSFRTIKFRRSDSQELFDYNNYFRVISLDSYLSNSKTYSHFVIVNETESISTAPTTLYAYVGQFNTVDSEDSFKIDSKTTQTFKFFTAAKRLHEIKNISSYAFAGAQFTNILLPGSVSNLGENVFYKADVTGIYFESDSIEKDFEISDKAFNNMNSSELKFLIRGVSTIPPTSKLYIRLQDLGYSDIYIAEEE